MSHVWVKGKRALLIWELGDNVVSSGQALVYDFMLKEPNHFHNKFVAIAKIYWLFAHLAPEGGVGKTKLLPRNYNFIHAW